MQRVGWPELNLNLSKLAFGCAPVMGRVGRRQALNAMSQAYEHGVTHFDVARAYGFGEAERVLGTFLSDKRDRVTVATKFGILPAPLSRAARTLKPAVRVARKWVPGLAGAIKKTSGSLMTRGYYGLEEARRSVETSLTELDIEAIDILFVHECSDDDELQASLLAFLDRLKDAGKIRAWGLATPARNLVPIVQKLGRVPEVMQFACADFGMADEVPARHILHSPFALVARLRGPDGLPLPPVRAWARRHGLPESDLGQQLPALVLCSLLDRTADAVVLCSMFQASNILTNVHAAAAPASDELLASFRQLLRSLPD